MSAAKATIKRTMVQGIIVTALHLSASAAQAGPIGIDNFNAAPSSGSPQNNKQGRPVETGAQNMPSGQTPAEAWFQKFDELQQKYRPSDSDKVILVRPLMQEAERVRQWTATAKKVASNYEILAKSIKKLPTPAGMSDIKEYRDLTADWYQDAASVYTDLIRPRPAAKTIEELQESTNVVKKKSEGLSSTIANLKSMDLSLRRTYGVHLALQDDALQQYVKSK